MLHVFSQLSAGGGARAGITLAKYSGRQSHFDHTLLSLLPVGAHARRLAREAGLAVLVPATPQERLAAVSAADIVHVHFWNSPALYAFLRSDWPLARLVIWLHVAGDTVPQILTQPVANLADFIAASGASRAALPSLSAPSAAPCRVIPAAPDFEKLAGLAAQPHLGFNVGYIGTVDFDKMHPDFVALHAGVNIPGVRFVVCGPGTAYPRLRHQADERGVSERFDFRGMVDDVRPTLSELDVFGYPLRPDNYSTAELALREAMVAGVPPVVFPFGGAGRTVTHNVTGLVVPDAAAYRAAIEWLYAHPAERTRLGRNAQAEALRNFGPEAMAAQFNALYDDLLRSPKHERAWSGAARRGAEYFIESLGEFGEDFTTSMAADDPNGTLSAEARIASASTLLASGGAGGILQYRNSYVEDAYLRLWAGLVLLGQGRPALAVAEFEAAARLGLGHWRVAWYEARAAEACGAWQLAATSLDKALAAAPDFRPAQDMARRLAA